MFGYVRPLQSRLSQEDWGGYQQTYCGLCRCLKRRCGFAARFTLNYDFVFLTLLLEEGERRCAPTRRCAAHPLKGRSCMEPSPAMDLCASRSVVLTYYKLLDGVRDEGFWKGLGYRLAALTLRRAYRKAKKEHGEFDAHVAACLGELSALEKENSPKLDRVADTFARLLAAAAPTTQEERLDRPRRELLYHLGRWIYLTDALDDLAQDVEKGRYNPIAARFGQAPDMDYLTTTMTHSLSLAQSAFQLLPATCWSELLENILYLGLPNVQTLVREGKWAEQSKMSRRKRQ